MCDSTAVDKAIMAPNVKKSKKKTIPNDYFVMGETAEQILRKLNKKIKKDYQVLVRTLPRRPGRPQKANVTRSFMVKPPRKRPINC